MTEARTCEFDLNNPKKPIYRSTLGELKDEVGISGLCCYGEKDDEGGILKDGLSGLCAYGADQDDKGGILEGGLCSYGVKDDKGGILKDGSSGLGCYGEKDDKGGILEDGFSGLPYYVDEDGLSVLSCYGDEDDKGGILKDRLSGLGCYGEKDVKGGILESGFSGLPYSVDEDGLSVLSCYGDEDDKGGILEDGFSGLQCSRDEKGLSGLYSYGDKEVKGGILENWLAGLGCYGDEDGKGRILEGEFSGLPSSGDEDGLSGLCSYGDDEEVEAVILEDWLSRGRSYGDEDDKGGILEEKGKNIVRICETAASRLRRDPLVVLGSDIMLIILSCLDARSVALCLVVSYGWRALASCDKIWSSKCEELWQGKAHLPRIAKVNRLSKLAVYSMSIMDGKRERIRKEDLYDHVWEFHFTEAAPEYWRILDPYWTRTGPPMRRYFLPDGSHTAEPDDKIWGGHECCYCIVTGVLADGKIRQHYVRINRWPPMYVTRKEDWSWEISNDMCIYRSIPDADKEDGTGPL